MVEKKIKIKANNASFIPTKHYNADACFDCKARTYGILNPKARLTIPLGFRIAIPDGYEGVIRGRSGLSSIGIDVSIGTIDSGYLGEVCATVTNNSDYPFIIQVGDRICQLAIREVPSIIFEQVDNLEMESDRKENGFGSSGIR